MQANELLAQIDALKSEIDQLRPLKPEMEHRIMQKFRLDWNYHSNAIEGNTLTLGETRAFLMEGLTANGKPLKDHLDIKGHDELITFLELFIQRKEILTEAAIREMHKILLKEPYEADAITTDGRIFKRKVRLGTYKTEPNCVRTNSGQIHQYILPEEVPAKMAELVSWHREVDAQKDLHPLAHAALFHHGFAAIHPFDDGNGRLARILMNLILMRSGFPPVVIKLQNRDRYVAALRMADAGENAAMVSFLGQSLVDAEMLYLRGAKGEPIEDFDDIDKKIALFKQELSHVPEPVQLTPDLQLHFIKRFASPCFNRLVQKLSQFDEFYSERSFSHSLMVWLNTEMTSQMQGPSDQIEKHEFIAHIQNWLQNQRCFYCNIQAHFSWSGFMKAGTNTFGDACQLTFLFEKYRYTVTAAHAGNPVFQCSNVYQILPTEDQILQLLNGMAEACLTHIQRQIRPKS